MDFDSISKVMQKLLLLLLNNLKFKELEIKKVLEKTQTLVGV